MPTGYPVDMTLQILLWIIAVVLFVVAAFPAVARYNLVPIGLAFTVAGFLAGVL